jgi:hypothetical protein
MRRTENRAIDSRLSIDTSGQFQSAAPTTLFSVNSLAPQGSVGRQFAVTKDVRFLINWLAAVQR